MPILRKSCWCCSLRIGSIVIGILGIVFAIIALIFSLSTNVKTKAISVEHLSPTVVRDFLFETLQCLFMLAWLIFSITTIIIIVKVILCLNVAMFVAASALLIVGAVLRKQWYLLPWLAIHLLMTAAFVVSFIYTTVQLYVYHDILGGSLSLITGVLLTVLYIYFWLVVFSYFQFLRERSASNSGSSISK